MSVPAAAGVGGRSSNGVRGGGSGGGGERLGAHAALARVEVRDERVPEVAVAPDDRVESLGAPLDASSRRQGRAVGPEDEQRDPVESTAVDEHRGAPAEE